MPRSAEQTEKKTSITVPPDLWRRAKVAAAERDTTIHDLLIRALERELTTPARPAGKGR